MILKETILSMFTEKATLLKWLKKVEAALNNAVLSDISVVQVSETEVKLKFTFEDGEYVESPVLTLPRGEKGEKGEDGKDGLDGEGIAATIQVGTVTTGAAGTDASVVNVGTEQRAVFDFVIPRGDTGASGEEGSAGVGFDDASLIESNNNPDVVLGTAGFTIEGYMKVTAGDEVFEIPSKMILPLASGEGVVVDVNEGGTGVEIHLDADVAMKLAAVLTTPTSAPSSISLVAVGTNNAQTMLTLGDGLSVADGVISASGGGSSDGDIGVASIYYDTRGFNPTRMLYPKVVRVEASTDAEIIKAVVKCIPVINMSGIKYLRPSDANPYFEYSENGSTWTQGHSYSVADDAISIYLTAYGSSGN